MSKRTILVDKDEGPYVCDNTRQDLTNMALILAFVAGLCVIAGWLFGLEPSHLLELIVG